MPINVNKAVDKAYETKSLKEIANAPVAARSGSSASRPSATSAPGSSPPGPVPSSTSPSSRSDPLADVPTHRILTVKIRGKRG